MSAVRAPDQPAGIEPRAAELLPGVPALGPTNGGDRPDYPAAARPAPARFPAMLSSNRCDATAISSTATSKAASCRDDGLTNPLTLRTNCLAAARISSSVATTSEWRRVLMLRHMAPID